MPLHDRGGPRQFNASRRRSTHECWERDRGGKEEATGRWRGPPKVRTRSLLKRLVVDGGANPLGPREHAVNKPAGKFPEQIRVRV